MLTDRELKFFLESLEFDLIFSKSTESECLYSLLLAAHHRWQETVKTVETDWTENPQPVRLIP